MNFIVSLFGFLLSTQLGKHFFLPFSYLSGIRIDYLAPTLYAIDLVSIILIASLISERKWIAESTLPIIKKYRLSIVLGLLCVVLNAFSAPSIELWVYSLARVAQWIGILIFFMRYSTHKGIFNALMWGLCAGAIVQLVLTTMQLSLRQSIQGIWYWLGERRFTIATPSIAKAVVFDKEFLRPYGTFSHPNSLAGFYLLLYAFFLTNKEKLSYLLRIVLLFVTSALVIISFSRTVLVVYIAVNLLFLLRIPARCKLCTLAKCSVAAFLLIIILSISGDQQSLAKRQDFAQKAVSIIIQQPTTGTGLGGYLIKQHSYPQRFPVFFEQPVHSIYLYTLAQLGIPLTFLVCAFILFFIRKYFLHFSFILPLGVVLLTGMVDHYWLTLPQNLFISATIFGILIATHEKQISGNR